MMPKEPTEPSKQTVEKFPEIFGKMEMGGKLYAGSGSLVNLAEKLGQRAYMSFTKAKFKSQISDAIQMEDGGKIFKQIGAIPSVSELDLAKRFESRGIQTLFLKRQPKQQADGLFYFEKERRAFKADIKELREGGANSFYNAIKDKTEQAPNFVFDVKQIFSIKNAVQSIKDIFNAFPTVKGIFLVKGKKIKYITRRTMETLYEDVLYVLK